MQVCVDDPILTAAGSHEQRLWLFTVVLFVPGSSGLQIEFEKEARKAQESSGLVANGFALRRKRNTTHTSESPSCKGQRR